MRNSSGHPDSSIEGSASSVRGRRAFLKSSAILGALAAPAAALAGGGRRLSSPAGLPNLYPNWNEENFFEIQEDENAHVAFLLESLGQYARPRPTFAGLSQPDILSFAKVSKALENTGVGAYLAQRLSFTTRPTLRPLVRSLPSRPGTQGILTCS